MDATLTALTQFGAAGLIGLLWVFERRQAAVRERQLDEAHRKLTGQEQSLHALLAVIRDNTRALNALEHGQRRLIRLLESQQRRRAGAAPAPAPLGAPG